MFLKKYAVMKARRTESDELQCENLFDVSACRCNHVEIVVSYGKVRCKYQSQIAVQGDMLITSYRQHTESYRHNQTYD